MHAIEASQAAPPETAAASDCFRITAPATGAWAGREDRLAVMISGDWHFIDPAEGLMLFDRAADHMLVYRAGWQRAQAPAMPLGGTVIDVEARAAIAALVQSLKALGMLATAAP